MSLDDPSLARSMAELSAAMRIRILNQIREALLAHPLAHRMRVFGSAASGSKPVPFDLDVVVDLDTPAWAGSTIVRRRALPPATREALRALLEFAGAGPGADALDVFVRADGVLYVAVPAGTWWRVHPQGPSIWHAVQTRGRPLAELAPLALRPSGKSAGPAP